ncbi:MAG: TRIC cation channel family protein, partial [Candidatus Eremiobacteraeota bacterium]|nr:TRIC cation channel family protein [Candidatus Eremiobacteraeota bacterium]
MTPPLLSQFGFFTLGTIGYIDLIAATTNAFNGALLARKPNYYKHFTTIGVIILAYAGGIGGGVIRDVLINKVPSPLIIPWYLIACLLAAWLALVIEYNIGQR